MNNSETNMMHEPESEDERRIDHLMDTRGLSYKDAHEEIEREKASLRRRAETRPSSGMQHERVRSFAHAAETLSLFDE